MKQLILVSSICVLSIAPLLAQENDQAEVWAASSLQKIRPDDPVQSANLVWSAETKTIRVAGARNEHVPFQVVITVPPPPNRYIPAESGFWVEGADLVSDGGRIPQDSIKLYFEHAILVYAASSPVGETGFWPDALAPLTSPFSMSAAFRKAVQNRAIWVDVVIPQDAPAGRYKSSIRVSKDGSLIDEINVELEVYDFELPTETHLLTFIGVSGGRLAELHGLEPSSPEIRDLMRSYHEHLYNNRMEPWFNRLLQPEINKTPDGQIKLHFDEALYDFYLRELNTKRVILEAAPRELRGNQRFSEMSTEIVKNLKSYIAETVSFFRSRGWLDRLVFNSPIDEPNTEQHYIDTRSWADLVHEVAPGVPFLVTESPIPDRNEWGPLTGHANNFSIHGNKLNHPAIRDAIADQRAEGGELSWYISCDQKFPQPNYFIDAPSMDPVMVPWITWRYQMHGILYWTINFWSQTPNPWIDPVTYLSGFFCSDGWVLNGEGSLIYPGSYTNQFTGQDDVDGPVSSIRFELLREGIEDYEYLWLLESLGEREFADEIVSDMVVDVSTFSRNEASLLKARQEMARRIEARGAR